MDPSRWLLLLRHLAEHDAHARDAVLSAHPELLAPEVEGALRVELEGLPAVECATLSRVLDEVVAKRSAIESRVAEYVLGEGPIERLWAAVQLKELEVDYAERLARERAAEAVLAPVYVAVLRSAAVRIRRSGGAAAALILLRVTLAALDARPGGTTRDQPGRETCLTFADYARVVLSDEADGRLFRRAYGLAAAVVEWARESGDRALLADALRTLGLLHIDPWSSGRRLDMNLGQVLWRWQQRFFEDHADDLVGIPEAEWRMPPTSETLTTGIRLLREAADLLEGHERALLLKRCIEASIAQRELGGNVEAAELLTTATKALALLERNRDPQERLGLLNGIRLLGGDVEREDVEVTLANSIDEQIRRHGLEAAAGILIQASRALMTSDPARALEVARDLRTVTTLLGTERDREALWMHQLDLIQTAHAGDVPMTPDLPALETAARELRRYADEEAWDVIRLAASLLRLAHRSPNIDAEERGLEFLDEIGELAPAFAIEYADALTYLRGELHVGCGATSFLAGDVGSAVNPYGTALKIFLDLGLPSRALDMVGRLRDCAIQGSPDVAVQAALRLGSFALELEAALAETAVRLVQDVCRITLSRISVGSVNPEVLIFLLQAAKGQRFGAQMFAGVRYTPSGDEVGAGLLERIAEAEREAGVDSERARSALDEGTLLSAYVRPDNPQQGDTPADRLANLRHAYDAHVNRQLLGAKAEVVYMPGESIQASLDDRTVLLILYLGMTSANNLAVTALALTNDDMRVVTVDHGLPHHLVMTEIDGRTVHMSPFAYLVHNVREELERAPEPWVATSGALESLRSGRESWFGNILDDLDAWRSAGKDHLCIVPHGPLHMYPFHLLPDGDEPLAATWRVTYLPNLYLLAADLRAGLRHRRGDALAVFGLSYEDEDPRGLAPLRQARNEAVRIAGHFDVDPVLDGDVTEERLIQGLLRARWVHLAAHGRHDVVAPAFQCLYLTPAAGSDGRLSAHELLAYDLRGTELLTLSACETALGRFDVADNIVGLPASLLVAGVETIIGTLWRVETNASEHFFSELYRALKGGANRLDAFAEAQRSTRSAFPAYRDWGCFYYVGEWR